MKAAVFHGPGDIRIEERPKPPVARDAVLIGVEWSSLCGTDHHIYFGNFDVETPLILGHDFSGVVAEVGADVTRVSVGDRVTAEPIRYCGSCDACLKGRYTVCERRSIMGMHVDGSLAEYVAAPEKNVFPVPEPVSSEEAALVEAAAVALHTMDYAKPLPGETAVIVGQGPIGMLHTQVAKTAGLRVIAAETSPARRVLADRFGADLVVDPSEQDLQVALAELGSGGDIVIDTTGSPASVRNTPLLARNSGKVMLVGSSRELMTQGPRAELILSKELTVYGVAGAPLKYPVALSLVASGALDVRTLITHRFDIGEIDEALNLPGRDPESIKALVTTG